MSETEKRINIAIRIRPALQDADERYETQQTRRIDDSSVAVTVEDAGGNRVPNCFTFDTIFDEFDTQQTFYEEAVRGMVDHALSGCNSTIFAHGQTGSGKTYTILGEGTTKKTSVGKESGVFLRIFEDLFWYRTAVSSLRHVVVALSAVELYVEEVLDLFNNKAPVKMREAGDDTHLPDVRCAVIDSMEDALHYFSLATSQRATAVTQIHDRSSRSHAVFFIDLFVLPVNESSPNPPAVSQLFAEDAAARIPGLVRSRISLVDLAGSERVKKSGAEGVQLIEANAIHKSLTSLHMVVHAMWVQSPHIPFRDSKLTRLLRSSFTDCTSSVLLIGNIAPGRSCALESLGTLRFCDNVKALKFAGTSPLIDPHEQDLFAAEVRRHDEICADLRILAVLHHYNPQRPRAYAKARGVPFGGALAVLTEQYRRASTEDSRERENKEREDMHNEAVFEAHRARMEWQQRYAERTTRLQLTTEETDTLRTMLAGEEGPQKEETERRLREAKLTKRNRLDLEARLQKIQEKLTREQLVLQRLSIDVAAKMKENRTAESMEEDELWEEFEENWMVAEANHGIMDLFFKEWSQLTCLHSDYVTTTGHVDILFDEVSQLCQQYVLLEIGDLVADVIEFAVDRSADVAEHRIDGSDSYTWFDIKTVSQQRRLRNCAVWTRPLAITPNPHFAFPRSCEAPRFTVISDDEGLGESGSQQLPSPSSTQQEPSLKRSMSAKSTAATKSYDVHEADKVYLMTVYDSPTLVPDVLKFMASPTIMTKHGRHGRPHFRKFWVSPSMVGGGRDLVWSDPEEGPKAQISGVSINEIAGIQLGPFSKVFERSGIIPVSKEFYLSFSAILKGSSRTVDITADTLVNFEAWVLGLSHMTRVEPKWGKPLDISRDQATWQLTRKERSMCEENCIQASVFLRVKEKVVALREEVAMHMRLFQNNPAHAYDSLGGIHAPQMNNAGAVLMTKGELRYHGSPYDIDIFRICKMWSLFEEENLIYDPCFVSPTESFAGKNSPTAHQRRIVNQ